jgi:hypothetical protein
VPDFYKGNTLARKKHAKAAATRVLRARGFENSS